MAARSVNTDLDLMGTGRVRGLAAPVLPGDAATKAYADAAGGGGGGTVILNGNGLGAVPPDFILDGNG